jgi:hypothetical protein
MDKLETRIVEGKRVSTAMSGNRLLNTFQIEWNFVPSPSGGAWGDGWTLHTDLGHVPAKAAQAKMVALRDRFDNEIRHHFRLVKTSRRVFAGEGVSTKQAQSYA